MYVAMRINACRAFIELKKKSVFLASLPFKIKEIIMNRKVFLFTLASIAGCSTFHVLTLLSVLFLFCFSGIIIEICNE